MFLRAWACFYNKLPPLCPLAVLHQRCFVARGSLFHFVLNKLAELQVGGCSCCMLQPAGAQGLQLLQRMGLKPTACLAQLLFTAKRLLGAQLRCCPARPCCTLWRRQPPGLPRSPA